MSGEEVCIIVIPNDLPTEENGHEGNTTNNVQHTEEYPCPECEQSLASRLRYHTIPKKSRKSMFRFRRDPTWDPIGSETVGIQCDSVTRIASDPSNSCRIRYQAPGKKDSITIKENGEKKKLQKRYLLYSLNEIYQLFIEENPQIAIGCSSFKSLRPCNVLYKSETPHNLCLCIHHENICLLLQAINERVHGLKSIDLHSFVKLLVCDDTKELCMFKDCSRCSDNFKIKIQDQIIDPSAIIKWSLWSTTKENRTVKVDYDGTVQNCVNVLQTKINPFLFHVFIKRQQSNFFEMFKKKCYR
ncbi:unnamed protein product [Adineta ricciae]|uniref:Uncharacterized protein n=1 Tax=Adineta ricciae TaxID=249248 RepID=A0A815F0Q4_ADIRI|nr:unnamed protein product [Adineta ricciae]